MSILHHIQQQRPGRQFPDRASGFVFAFEAFQEADVGTEISGGAQACQAFVIAVLLVGVGPCDEHDVGVRFVDRGFGCFDAGEVDFLGDDLLPGQVATALGEELVFDVETGDVGSYVLVDGCRDRDRA